MLSKIIKTANACTNKELTFEIGSNSDLILENTITGNLPWTIENFAKSERGFLTFPTKFDMIDPLLNIEKGREKIIIRISINPDKIINQYEPRNLKTKRTHSHNNSIKKSRIQNSAS